MGNRRKARESALQILFQLDFDQASMEEALRGYWVDRQAREDVKEYTRWLVSGIISRRQSLDGIIQEYSRNWRVSRMAVVDRNLLRMAVFELVFEPAIAPAIIINEAIEIAKKFGSEQSAQFANGILDSIRKNIASIKESFEGGENAGEQEGSETNEPSR